MLIKIGNKTLSLIIGDITLQKTDAIINAANSYLLGGGGVDGAIHRVAGRELLFECKKIKEENLAETDGLLPPGESVLTNGYNLFAKYVIHTVGPIYRGQDLDRLTLQNAYKNSLLLAERSGITSISFPSISTGAYGYPVKTAAKIALETVIEFLRASSTVSEVVFVLFSEDDYDVYEETLGKLI